MTNAFYRNDDHPDPDARRRMWGAIRGTLPLRRPVLMIGDLRSFAYGVAASVIVYLAAVGALATYRGAVREATPEAVRLDEAYRSAIRELERVAPVRAAGDGKNGSTAARLTELQRIDAAIAALRSVTGDGDLSPLTQRRLRQLYALKLQTLQQIIENGEWEL